MLVAVLSFGLGMVLQALLMLRGDFRRGDAWRAVGAIAFGLVGMFPGKHEHEYRLMEHVFFALLFAGGMFAFLFRDRLLRRIGGRLLLAWNIVLVYVVLAGGWGSPTQLLLLLVPTVPTVVNAFTDMDQVFAWKVFFHTWFSTILVVVTIVGLDTGALGVFSQERGAAAVTRPPLEMIAGGAAFLYIVANAWFVLALVPIPTSRSQRWSERAGEIRRHMELLARGYVWEEDDVVRSLSVLVGLPLLLFGIARWGARDSRAMIPFAIALMPWIAGGEAADAPPPGPKKGPAQARPRRRRQADTAHREKRA